MLRNCEVCSKRFRTSIYDIKQGHGRYCSRQCKGISSRGIPSKRRIPIEKRFWTKVLKTDGCWLWQAYKHPKGYGYVGVEGNRNDKAHRVAYRLTYGDFDRKLHVLHKCDNPPCVRPDHLFLGTNLDNIKDRMAKGRMTGLKGEKNPRAKLTMDQAREIRAIKGISQEKIAQRYHVTQSLISKIKLKQNWDY
ncbi:MAG TPA: HNH endonuclease [Chloroflexia bacterium]|nr:HNH endonuclease [Chloroflexia bacterium]